MSEVIAALESLIRTLVELFGVNTTLTVSLLVGIYFFFGRRKKDKEQLIVAKDSIDTKNILIKDLTKRLEALEQSIYLNEKMDKVEAQRIIQDPVLYLNKQKASERDLKSPDKD